MCLPILYPFKLGFFTIRKSDRFVMSEEIKCNFQELSQFKL